jgi:flagellar biosynthetic protein FlhB
MAGERTEAPTPKRRQEARRKGDISKSQDLVSTGVLLAAVVGLRVVGGNLWADMEGFLRDGLGTQPAGEMTAESTFAFGKERAAQTLLALAPLLALVAVAGVAMNLSQSGLVLTGSALQPKLNRLNPGAGLKRLFSAEGLMNLVKAIVKMAVISLVVWMTLKGQFAEISGLGQMSVAASTARIGMLAFDIAIRAAVVLFLLSILDYAWQRRQWLKRQRMSKEDVRQEMRETEGDPQIKAAIRRRRQALMNRMIAAVPKADVVVTNPTHYAVALQYDPVSMKAPIVVAKGERLLAQRIKEVAKHHNVPVLEEPPLARALYAAVQVGHPVPANLFHAVAEVLAWVYALRTKTPFARRSGMQRARA